jgi:hypothetical protein
MIYYRIKPNKDINYRLGFGIDFDLLNKVIKAKLKLGKKIPNLIKFDNRKGFAIDSTKFNNQYHPIFQFDILDTESNELLQIDSYSQCFYFGEYWQILAMNKETRSHRQILWKNINCKEPKFVEKINKNKKRYKLIKAEKCRWLPNGDPNLKNQ